MLSITGKELESDIKKLANPEKAANLARFFKTGKGQYGEGDVFLGIMVPELRKLTQKYAQKLDFADIRLFLHSKIHEYRFLALLLLDKQYSLTKKEPEKQAKIAEFYLDNLDYK